MAEIETEILEGVLWVMGHVDRSMGDRLSEALEAYAPTIQSAPILDMSDVPYFATGAAKTLIGTAQDLESSGRKLTIRSSKPVAQTLSLLGAKSWMNIEVCQRPNPKPGEDLALETPSARAPGRSKLPPKKSAANARIHEGSIASYRPSLNITAASKGKKDTKPVQKTPGTSGVSGGGADLNDDPTIREAEARKGEALVSSDVELPDELIVLRELKILGTYTFHFVGSEADLTTKAVKYIAGPWILTDSKGTRRYVNITHASFVDVLGQ